MPKIPLCGARRKRSLHVCHWQRSGEKIFCSVTYITGNSIFGKILPESLNSAVSFPHSSGLLSNHSIHQKYNTYIVRQIEIFHRSCSRFAGSYWLLCKSTFLPAYKNWRPDKTLPSPLLYEISFYWPVSQNFSIFFIKIVETDITKTAGENVLYFFSIQTGICCCCCYRLERQFPLMGSISLAALFMPELKSSHN